MGIDVRIAQAGSLFSEGIEARPPRTPRERLARRKALFAETPSVALRRRARAIVGALKPGRLTSLPARLGFLLRERAVRADGLPDPTQALGAPDGVCGLVSDASATAVMEALARGLYPAAGAGPLAWRSPATRRVLRLRSWRWPPVAQRVERLEPLRVAVDMDFDATLAAQARADWVTSGVLRSPRGLALLATLADEGYAHALDLNDATGGRLAGVFGVAVGKIFVTLGAFGRTADHADLALIAWSRLLQQKGFVLHDCVAQAEVAHLGFVPMPRADFLSLLRANAGLARPGRWTLDNARLRDPGLEASPHGAPPRAQDWTADPERCGPTAPVAA